MASNKLKLNPDKTEFILLGTDTHRSRLRNLFPVDILGNACTPTSKVKNLGVIFYSSLSMSKQVSQICKSCFYHIRDFRRIRRFLSKSVSVSLANALVTSRIDYCNSLLYDITVKQSRRLQLVENTLCRIINHLPKYSRISRELKLLHRLPVEFIITFKILLITYYTKLSPYTYTTVTDKRVDPTLVTNTFTFHPFSIKYTNQKTTLAGLSGLLRLLLRLCGIPCPFTFERLLP